MELMELKILQEKLIVVVQEIVINIVILVKLLPLEQMALNGDMKMENLAKLIQINVGEIIIIEKKLPMGIHIAHLVIILLLEMMELVGDGKIKCLVL